MNNLNRIRYLKDLIKENPDFVKRFIKYDAMEREITLMGLDTYKKDYVSKQIAITEKLNYHPFLFRDSELCLVSCEPTKFRIKLIGKGGEEKGIDAMHAYGRELYSNIGYNAVGDVLSYEYFCELPEYLKYLELTDKQKIEQEFYDKSSLKIRVSDNRKYILASFCEDTRIGEYEVNLNHENVQIYLVDNGRCYLKMVNNKSPYSRLLIPDVNDSMRVLIHLPIETSIEISDIEKDGLTKENPLSIVSSGYRSTLLLENRVNSLEEELKEMREEIKILKLR